MEIFRKFDTNGDGYISLTEFMKMYHALFPYKWGFIIMRNFVLGADIIAPSYVTHLNLSYIIYF